MASSDTEYSDGADSDDTVLSNRELERNAYRDRLCQMTTTDLMTLCKSLGLEPPLAQVMHSNSKRRAFIEKVVEAQYPTTSRVPRAKRVSVALPVEATLNKETKE